MQSNLVGTLHALVVHPTFKTSSNIFSSLVEMGFSKVIHADTVADANAALKTQKFDLVVCAYCVETQQDGFLFFNQAKQNKQILEQTAFVIVSDTASISAIQSVIDIQPDDFLASPFSELEFQTRIASVMKRKFTLLHVLKSIDNCYFCDALMQIDAFISDKNNKAYLPFALELKGRILILNAHFAEAEQLYLPLLRSYPKGWVKVGLIRAYLGQNKRKLAQDLIDIMLNNQSLIILALHLQIELYCQAKKYHLALSTCLSAIKISPNNTSRLEQGRLLAMLTNDVEAEIKLAERLLNMSITNKYTDKSHYLNIIRAYINKAFESKIEGLPQISIAIKKYEQCLKQFTNTNKSPNNIESSIANARFYHLQLNQSKTKLAVSNIAKENYFQFNNDTLIDLIRMYQSLDMFDSANDIIEFMEERLGGYVVPTTADLVIESASNISVYCAMIKRLKLNNVSMSISAQELNNDAIKAFKLGDSLTAIHSLTKALTHMPENASIALNLLHAMTLKPVSRSAVAYEHIVLQCMSALNSASLKPAQYSLLNKLRTQIGV